MIRALLRFAGLLALALPAAAEEGVSSFAVPMPPPRMEARQVSVVVDPGITSTGELPTEALRQVRRDMMADLPVHEQDLRALAEQGDGLAAQRYVRLLLSRGTGVSDSDVAWFGTIAVRTGRVWTLPQVVAALSRLDPATEPPERVADYAAMLYPHAWAGNALALDALIDLNGEGRLFGPMSEATRQRILETGATMGDGRVPLRMALAILRDGEPDGEARALAIDYLARARGGSDPAVAAMAAALLGRLEGQAALSGSSR